MKSTILLAGFCLSLATAGSAQTQLETKLVTIDGEVVRYEPGHVIVIHRASDNQDGTYTLTPSMTMPADVRVGGRVSLYTQPSADGSVVVSRVVTTSLTPRGNVKTTTEETRTQPSGETTRTVTTEISGKVEAYEAGKTVTIVRADGTQVTYTINSQSTVPGDLLIGKPIYIVPLAGGSSTQLVVKTITIREK